MADVLINIFKFFLTLLLLPLVVACVMAFTEHIIVYPGIYQDYFLWGSIAFLITFLLLHQFWGVYEFGQRIVMGVFRVFAPLDRLLSYFVPFYLSAVLLTFYVITNFFHTNRYDPYFLFFAGFTFSLHILLVAQELQDQEKQSVKTSYLLTMCGVIVVNLFVLVFLLDINVGKMTIPMYFQSAMVKSQEVYAFVVQKIIFLQ